MTGYERRTLRKRATILATSKALFKERGIAQVSMDEIASRADVSKVTIYKYFQSKESLVSELVDAVFHGIIEAYDEMFVSPRSFVEKLSGYVALRQQSIVEKDHLLVDQACKLYSSLHEGVVRHQERAIAYLLRLFREGKKGGAVDPDVDDELVALHFDVLMCYLRHSPDSIESLYADPEKYKRSMTLFWSPIVQLPS